MAERRDKSFDDRLKKYAGAFKSAVTGKKAMAYAAATGAVAAFPSVCLPAIVYTDPVDITLNEPSSGTTSTSLNIDGTGPNDFLMKANTNGTSGYIWLTGTTSSNPAVGVFTAQTLYLGRALSNSYSIGPSNTAWGLWGSLVRGATSNTGYLAGQGNKYLGIRFQIGGNWHYGWIQVNVPPGGNSITILDWAYEDQPNTPIHVGSTQPVQVPTLNEWGMTVFILIMAGLALRMMKKRDEIAA